MSEAASTIRGTIIKVPGAEPGLIMANGKQLAFRVEETWASPVAPAPNQSVDVTVHGDGRVTRVAVVEAQQLAREKLDQFRGVAGEHGQQAAAAAKANFHVLAGRMGMPMLVGALVLWVAWFLLPSLHVNFGGFQLRSFTFSQLLGLSLADGEATSHFGVWSFLGLAAIVSPWISPWLRQRWAPLLNAAPLVFVVLTFIKVKWQIHSMTSDAVDQASGLLNGAQAHAAMGRMIDQMVDQVMQSISFGSGLWLVLLSALLLAGSGFLRYRSTSALT